MQTKTFSRTRAVVGYLYAQERIHAHAPRAGAVIKNTASASRERVFGSATCCNEIAPLRAETPLNNHCKTALLGRYDTHHITNKTLWRGVPARTCSRHSAASHAACVRHRTSCAAHDARMRRMMLWLTIAGRLYSASPSDGASQRCPSRRRCCPLLHMRVPASNVIVRCRSIPSNVARKRVLSGRVAHVAASL